MPEYSRHLGECIKKARIDMGLTQSEVADRIDVDVRTIINIENHRGNPKMEVLYPLVRTLQIDPWELYYPELKNKGNAFRQMQIILAECNEQEIDSLLPVFRAVLSVVRANDTSIIE